jgi:hypothetical protein
MVLGNAFGLVFLPLMAAILLQLAVGFYYQVEFFIAIQWKLYRFLAYPFIASYLVK